MISLRNKLLLKTHATDKKHWRPALYPDEAVYRTAPATQGLLKSTLAPQEVNLQRTAYVQWNFLPGEIQFYTENVYASFTNSLSA